MPIITNDPNSVNLHEVLLKIGAAQESICQKLTGPENNSHKLIDLGSALRNTGLDTRIYKNTDLRQYRYGNLDVPLGGNYTLEIELPIDPGVERSTLGFLNPNVYGNNAQQY